MRSPAPEAGGREHARIFRRRPDVDFVAVCGRDQVKTVARAAEYGVRAHTDINTMLDREQPALVAICLPNQSHYDATLRVIRAGYQVDMGDGYWGCLWDERGQGMVARYPRENADKIFHKNDWNHYFVIARGHHIQIWLNGVQTVDMVNEKGRLTGPVGIQLCHGEPTEVWFKNIHVKMLPEAGK